MRHKYYSLIMAVICSLCLSVGSTAQKKGKVYLVSNAHLDTQWNWDIKTTIGEYLPATLERNFSLFKRYPFYIFNFEGAVKYNWMKEYYPQDYEQIKKYVAEGRWHISGSSWDANDPNMPSPESFARNILYGQKFYKQEFGVESTDIFLPDCFGFGWTLPSIANHFGLIGFSTQKLQWRTNPFHNGKKVPFEIGLWQGIDGNKIMIAANCQKYAQKWPMHDLTQDKELKQMVEDSKLGLAMRYFGTGDRGGSVDGQTMETIKYSLAQKDGLQLDVVSSDQMFKDFQPYDKHPELPVWNGELLMDVHATGCYTSQAAMKLFNRRNEQIADAAERSAVVADILKSQTYPGDLLETAWKRFIWHQFHDDLTGTSIPRAYEFSWNDELISLRQFESVVTSSATAVASNLDTRTKGTPIVIYNPIAQDRTEVLEIGGKTYKVTIPSVGFKVIDMKNVYCKGSAKASLKDKPTLENAQVKVTLNKDGDICSIIDKKSGRELVENGKAIRLAVFTKNVSTKYPAWELMKEVIDRTPEAINDDVKISIAENKGAIAALKVDKKSGDSHFVQTISLQDGSPRIDIDNEVDWVELGSLLKAEFPLSVSNEKAWYDLGLGAIARGNNTKTAYEVYAHQWANIDNNDGSYGVAIMNDCKYGWDKPSNNTLRLTLLHTPSVNNRYVYQAQQDHGHHTFRYSIMGHSGTWQEAGVVGEAQKVNQPVKAFITKKHEGSLGKEFSFVKSSNDAIAIRAIKKAEDGDGYIVRVYETKGTGIQTGKLEFACPIASSIEVDGNERAIGSETTGKLDINIGAFGIKTYRVHFKSNLVGKQLKTAEVTLPYDRYYASYNGFRKEVEIGNDNHSYAAELIPASLNYEGINFNLADPAKHSAVACSGQTISLPEGNWKSLYLLAASTSGDVITQMNINGRETTINVPDYHSFYGQWGHKGHTESFEKRVAPAFIGTHMHDAISDKDMIYDYSYMYFIPISIPEGTKEITLPKERRILVFAATVSSEDNSAFKSCNSITNVILPEVKFSTDKPAFDLAESCRIADCSGQARSSEGAEKALDFDNQTKWCDNSKASEKFFVVDLGESKEFNRWKVLHATHEAKNYTTSDFSILVSEDMKEWKKLDEVKGNSEALTDRTLPTTAKGRYVKFSTTKADQSNSNIARIYSFSIY